MIDCFGLAFLFSILQYPRKAETAFTGDLEAVKEGAKYYLSSGKEHLMHVCHFSSGLPADDTQQILQSEIPLLTIFCYLSFCARYAKEIQGENLVGKVDSQEECVL